jgi:hypothetical protein
MVGVRYPTLGTTARIKDDVVFQVSAPETRPETRLISGHPVLASTATTNLATWDPPPLPSGKYVFIYHFQLVDFELRKQRCYSNSAPVPPTRYTVGREGNDYRIEVFVTAHAQCPTAN